MLANDGPPMILDLIYLSNGLELGFSMLAPSVPAATHHFFFWDNYPLLFMMMA